MFQKKKMKRLVLFIKKTFSYYALGFFLKRKNRVIYTSIPKAGTNLLFNILINIPYYRFVIRRGVRPWLFDNKKKYLSVFKKLKKGAIIKGHIPFDSQFQSFVLKENGYAVILLVRDPRDVIVSTYHYLNSMDRSHKSYQFFKNLNKENRIKAILYGHENYFEPLKDIYDKYLNWQSLDNCFLLKYEDLIDIKNGDLDPKNIFEELKNILDINTSDLKLLEFLRDDSNSNTLRKGKYGEWRSFFNQKQKNYISNELESIIGKIGY